MDDQPIAHTKDGRPLFDNAPTVVCVLVEDHHGRILAIRRARNPGSGLIGLPGGYHMRGETWQEAGCREVLEETGIALPASEISLMHLVTDEYGNNLILARCMTSIDGSAARPVDGEASEVIWLTDGQVGPADWAFPRHYGAVSHYRVHHAIKTH
ncbi:NUDIX domain-containing protein [Paracoccus litorisediminis]|uniref:NUDIX domain-containing protein n=1 Tax=Paracoccus litorisediminis TaxID=2006130 RepID=UPI003733D7F1